MYKYLFVCLPLLAIAVSCEDYLDKAPDMGLDESTIYENYESIRGYLDPACEYICKWNAVIPTEVMNVYGHTDEVGSMVSEKNDVVNILCTGNWYTTEKTVTWEIGDKVGDAINKTPIIANSYLGLRIANRVLNNLDKVKDWGDNPEENKALIVGQASFYRAWFYYEIIKRYGGMPKLDRVFWGGDDNLTRLTYQESSDWMMEDIDRAIENLPVKWDDSNMGRPDKTAAMAFKAQALLYQASPLYQNDLESTVKKPYDKALCLKAAKACQDVLHLVDTGTTGRKFTTGTMDDYRGIFLFAPTANFQEEYLWWNRIGGAQVNVIRIWWNWGELDSKEQTSAQSCATPTANIVEYYERKGSDGIYYPISDPRSGYVEGAWSAMKNRDPRMYNNITLPGERWGELKGAPYYIKSWEGGSGSNKIKSSNFTKARQFTGYLAKKFNWPNANNIDYTDNSCFNRYRFRSMFIRVTEMYLDYAEALFEATGSATTKPDGFDMTPAEALNIVRNRVGVTDVHPDYCAADKFRETYRRERTVELMFEFHRWEDIRRWMIFDEVFPTSTPIYNTVWTCDQGANVNPANYNDGKDLTFKWEKVHNTVEVRNYQTKHYFYPFPGSQVGSLSNLKQNPGW